MEARKECYICNNKKCPGQAAYNSIYCRGNRKYNEVIEEEEVEIEHTPLGTIVKK